MVLMDGVLSRNCLSFDDNDKRVREHPLGVNKRPSIVKVSLQI